MMTCPRCGRSNTERATSCAACGTRLEPEGDLSSGTDLADSPTELDGGALPQNPTLTTGAFASRSTGAPAVAASQIGPGTRLGNRYEIQAVLGEGGMGTVYKARDLELRRTVALKVIRPEMASRPEVVERFKREILLASQVTHKNVLRIHDLGEAGEVRFISMNYVEGSSLKALLGNEGPLPLDRALPLIRQVGEALQAAHEAGVVHRDLKPQNILIDTEGTAYIADFGISRSLDSGGTMTETGAILGTVDYMSPEQARGETPDHRGDIYSLGIILFEVFTGTLPFRSKSTLSIMMRRIHEDAPTIRKARPEIPVWLSAIVARALARDPKARYQSAGELLRDMERQRASRSWRRLARPRVAVPAAAAALAVLLAGAGLYLFRQDRTPSTEDRSAPAPVHVVAFLPFENGTGNPALDWTRTGIPALVSKGLGNAGEIRILGGDRTHQSLQDLKLPLTGVYAPFDLKRAASILGADILVTGVVRRAGDRFQAEARLLQPGRQGTREMAVERAEGIGEESVFALADTLAERIGSALKVRSSQRPGSRRTTTRSVEALRMYSEGLDLARSGRDLDAAKRLEEAVAKDPSFAVAYAQLSQTYGRLGQQDRALSFSDLAMKNLEAVSDHEARLIRARHALLENRRDLGIAEFRELLRSYPQDADARFDLATILEQKGDLAGAAAELERCVALDPKHVSALYSLGRIRLRQGDSEVALKIFSDLLAAYTQAGNDEGMGTVLHALGNVHKEMSHNADALRYYRQALEIRTRIGDRRGMAATLLSIAVVLRFQGQYAEAIRTSQEALDLRRQVGQPRGIAEAWIWLGEIHEEAGQIRDALRCYQESLGILRDLDDPPLLAQNVSSLGYVSSVLGNYAEAYLFYQEALAKRREIGDRRELLRSLIDVGLIEQVQGRYDKALGYAAEARTIVSEIGERAGGVVLATNVGMIHDDQGSYGAAIRSLTEAVNGARAIDNKHLLASALLYLGGTLAHLGDFTEAEKQLGEVERLVRETSNEALVPELLNYQAEVQVGRGEVSRCLQTLGVALKRAESLGDRRLIIETRLNLGRCSPFGPGQSGRSHLAWAIEEARKATLLPLRVRALSYLASLGSPGAPGAAEATAAEQALSLGRPLRLRESLIQASRILGQSARAKGDPVAAERLFREAGGWVKEMAADLDEPYRSVLLGRKDLARMSKDVAASTQPPGEPRKTLD